MSGVAKYISVYDINLSSVHAASYCLSNFVFRLAIFHVLLISHYVDFLCVLLPDEDICTLVSWVFLKVSFPIQYLDVGRAVTLDNSRCHSEQSSMSVLISFIKKCCLRSWT